MWFGLAGFSRAALMAAAGLATTLVALAVDSAFAVTVFAIARTSSRLKAIGLVAALRARMLSRRAVFFDGFSMGGRLPGAAGAVSAGLGAGTFRGSTPDAFFFGDLVFFVLSMGSLGGGLKSTGSRLSL